MSDAVNVGELVRVGDHEDVEDAVCVSEFVMVAEEDASAMTTLRINEFPVSGCARWEHRQNMQPSALTKLSEVHPK